MKSNEENNVLAENVLNDVSGGTDTVREATDCDRGIHRWEFTGVKRPGTQCSRAYADIYLDRQIKCSRCGVTGWRIFGVDNLWHYVLD